MHHGGHDKAQAVLAQLQGVALLDQQGGVDGGGVTGEESLQHGHGLGVADDLHAGPAQQHGLDHGGMVGFHMVDDQVIQTAAVQRSSHVLQELGAHRNVGGVHQRGFLVQNDVGVVGNTAGNGEQVLELGQATVAGAHVNDIRGNGLNVVHDLYLPEMVELQLIDKVFALPLSIAKMFRKK